MADVIRFGTFEVDRRSGELRKAGVRIPLQDQPFRVLTRLLEHPGEVVMREALQRELWPDNTFTDFEHGLNAAIKRLRDALGDSADSPRFIETLPRRGYRFIAPVVGVGSSVDTSPPTDTPVVSARSSWWKGAAAFLMLLVMAGAVWWGATARRRKPAQPNAAAAPLPANVSTRVAVAPFENRSNDASITPMGDQIAGRIVRGVAALPGVEAVAGRAESAALAVEGAFFLQGDRLELQSRIVDGASGKLLHALPPFGAPRADPGQAIDRLERHVAGAAAIHFDEFFGGLEFVSQPPTIDGYREYRTGLEIFSRDYPRAVAHLHRALEIDPQFWLPRLILYFAYGNAGQSEKSRAQLAELERDRGLRTPAERLFIDYVREASSGFSVEAVRILRDLDSMMPRSLLVNFNLVRELFRGNRPRAAIEVYERLTVDARTLRHSVGTWRVDFATRAMHLAGEHERELQESRRGAQNAPGMFMFTNGEARALAALGRHDDLKAVVDRSLTIPAIEGSVGGVLEQAALELRVHGYREASLEYAGRAVEWWGGRSSAGAGDRFALARAMYLAERWIDAEREFGALLAESAGDQDYIGYLGASAAGRGDAARTRAASQTLLTMRDPDLPGFHTYWRARLAAALGEREMALDLLRKALGEGAGYGLFLHQTTEFKSLRDYPPFQELVRPKD